MDSSVVKSYISPTCQRISIFTRISTVQTGRDFFTPMIMTTIKLVQQGLACQQFALYIAGSVRHYRRLLFIKKTDKNEQKKGRNQDRHNKTFDDIQFTVCYSNARSRYFDLRVLPCYIEDTQPRVFQSINSILLRCLSTGCAASGSNEEHMFYRF